MSDKNFANAVQKAIEGENFDLENLIQEWTSQGFYPLRPIQAWMIDTHLNKAKSTMMNIGALYELDSEIDIFRLENAINELLNNYDIFRCRLVFHPETGELCQRFDGEIFPVQVEEWSDEETEKFLKFLREPYFLINQPLYRIYIFKTPRINYLFADFYHGIFDGATIALLLTREADARYRGKILKRVPVKYSDYIIDEIKNLSEEIKIGDEYWFNILKNFDEKKHLPPADVEKSKDWKETIFDYDILNITAEFFKNKTCKEHIFFMAASMITLAKVANSKSSILSWIHNGRTNARELRVVGLMVEQFPISWNFENDLTVGEFFEELEKKIQESFQYRKSLSMTYYRGLQDNCATFIFQKKMHGDFSIGGKNAKYIEILPNDWSAAENSLDIEVNEDDDGIYFLELDYDASRYSENAMKNFAKVMDEVILQLQDENILVSQIFKS